MRSGCRQRLRHPLNRRRLAGLVVQFDDHALEQHAVAGDRKTTGLAGDEALDDGLDVAAQAALVRAGEARVAQEGRAAGEDLLVRRLHVRVRAHHGADLAVEHPRDGDFLRSRLGVHVHEDEGRVLAKLLHLGAHADEGVVHRRHEGAALQVDDGQQASVRQAMRGAALAGRAGRVVQRAHETRLIGEQRDDFLLVPEMVAAGDDVHAAGEEVRRSFRRDAGAAGGVLAIGDDDIERVTTPQDRHQFGHGLTSGRADHIADEEDFHSRETSRHG